MGSSYLPPPEQNVVNVGDELSQTALDAINAASFPSGANPLATIADVAAGITGPQGPPGPPGATGSGISWTYRGQYDGGITYAPNDYVSFQGSSYVMINFIGAAGYDPIGWPGSWQLVAQQGQQGVAGTNGDPGGPPGPQGDPGPQGYQGAQGDPGANAPPLIFRGYYNHTTQYDPYDVVYWVDDSNSYVMTQSAGGYGYYPDNATYWTLFNTGGHGNVFTTGATFTGKVNMAAPTAGSASLNLGVGTAPTTSVAGDIWIATNINFRDSVGTLKTVANSNTANTFSSSQTVDTSSATAALRVTQRGAGNAITVEDSTTPDATPFVVDQHGKVGVGIAPDATAAIKVDANGISFNGLVFNPTATAAHTGGSDTLDLLVTINGTNYRLGLRPA